jgi:hypothetical protein
VVEELDADIVSLDAGAEVAADNTRRTRVQVARASGE